MYAQATAWAIIQVWKLCLLGPPEKILCKVLEIPIKNVSAYFGFTVNNSDLTPSKQFLADRHENLP